MNDFLVSLSLFSYARSNQIRLNEYYRLAVKFMNWGELDSWSAERKGRHRGKKLFYSRWVPNWTTKQPLKPGKRIGIYLPSYLLFWMEENSKRDYPKIRKSTYNLLRGGLNMPAMWPSSNSWIQVKKKKNICSVY